MPTASRRTALVYQRLCCSLHESRPTLEAVDPSSADDATQSGRTVGRELVNKTRGLFDDKGFHLFLFSLPSTLLFICNGAQVSVNPTIPPNRKPQHASLSRRNPRLPSPNASSAREPITQPTRVPNAYLSWPSPLLLAPQFFLFLPYFQLKFSPESPLPGRSPQHPII